MVKRSGWHRKNKQTPNEKLRQAEYNSPQHRAIRAARQASHTSDSPCSRCGKPLGPKYKMRRDGTRICRWHVPHGPRINGVRQYLPGMWCESCNLGAAATEGARTRNRRPQALPRW